VHPRLARVHAGTAARDSIDSMLERVSAARFRLRRILRGRRDFRDFLEFRTFDLRRHSRRELIIRLILGVGFVMFFGAVGIAVAAVGG
jgi:hypothetical protein